jgi:hypothetical protein
VIIAQQDEPFYSRFPRPRRRQGMWLWLHLLSLASRSASQQHWHSSSSFFFFWQATASGINLGRCNEFSLIAGSTATCAGAANCFILEGKLGVAPGTAFTGNFVAATGTETAGTGANYDCRDDSIAAWTHGRLLSGPPLDAEIGGKTYTKGVHTHGSAINIALTDDTVTLDAEDDPNAVFIFNVATTLTTAAGSKIVLKNGAKPSNIYWVLGTALTMGAESTLVGNVLAGTAITIGTNGRIDGRAMAQTAVTCETGCTIKTGANPDCHDSVTKSFITGMNVYDVVKPNGEICVTNVPDTTGYNEYTCTSSTTGCSTKECVESKVSQAVADVIFTQCPTVRKNLIPRQPLL